MKKILVWGILCGFLLGQPVWARSHRASPAAKSAKSHRHSKRAKGSKDPKGGGEAGADLESEITAKDVTFNAKGRGKRPKSGKPSENKKTSVDESQETGF